MKVRFGVGLGADTGPAQLPGIVDRLESTGVDSLWLPERVYSQNVDPVVGMAFALSRTIRLKVGTSVAILPGRHPVLVAKQLSSLVALAPKRVLPVFGLRAAQPRERELFPVPIGKRGAVFDESLRLLRRALEGDGLPFNGEFFTVSDASVAPRPDRPLDIWLGGSTPGAFERIGRFGDGWLGSLLTPAEARRGRELIEAAALDAGRQIESDHFGINLVIAENGISDELAARLRRRRPDLDPADLVARDWTELHALIDGYLAAGLSKFVIGPGGGQPIEEFIDRFAGELIPRQTDADSYPSGRR